MADHAQSRAEQERDWKSKVAATRIPFSGAKLNHAADHSLPLPGLDGANPLAFLAAVGTLVVCDRLSLSESTPEWLQGSVALSWGSGGIPHTPVLHFPTAPPSPRAFIDNLAEQLARSADNHPVAWVVRMLDDKDQDLAKQIRDQCIPAHEKDRPCLDWVTALALETAPDLASRLQTVRRDYLLDNIRQIMQLTKANHLERALFHAWDYADALANQSLHWEPTEDRRHAYQWHMPSGDPTRNKRGGMLGANRLALEAWPLFPSFPAGDGITTRGFSGHRANDTFFTWPLWKLPLKIDGVASLLALKHLQADDPPCNQFKHYNVSHAFRLQRILVGKTPNFTTAFAIG